MEESYNLIADPNVVFNDLLKQAPDLYERLKRYENLLVPYELRHDLLLFFENFMLLDFAEI